MTCEGEGHHGLPPRHVKQADRVSTDFSCNVGGGATRSDSEESAIRPLLRARAGRRPWAAGVAAIRRGYHTIWISWSNNAILHWILNCWNDTISILNATTPLNPLRYDTLCDKRYDTLRLRFTGWRHRQNLLRYEATLFLTVTVFHYLTVTRNLLIMI